MTPFHLGSSDPLLLAARQAKSANAERVRIVGISPHGLCLMVQNTDEKVFHVTLTAILKDRIVKFAKTHNLNLAQTEVTDVPDDLKKIDLVVCDMKGFAHCVPYWVPELHQD